MFPKLNLIIFKQKALEIGSMEKTVNLQTNTIGEIVRFNANTISVFRKYGIDFYCKGKNLLANACALSHCDLQKVSEELRVAVSNDADDAPNFNSMSLEKLISHIVSAHHQYVNVSVPEISALFKTVSDASETNNLELKRINDLFRQLANDMKQHMQKEELALFPYIQKLELRQNLPEGSSVKSLITVVEFEHDTSGIIISQINRLCNNYSVPEGASQTFRSLFNKLSEFEADLIMHIHVENNVLHKKAIEMEQSLMN